MPNFASITQTVAEIWPFLIFQDGGRCHLGFSKCGNLRLGRLKTPKVRLHAKLSGDRLNVAEIWRFLGDRL